MEWVQIAVDNGFGGVYGQQKADWMVDVVQQYFHDNADLQQYEVEDFLTQLMDQEFDTVVEDGSLPQVSAGLLQLFDQWQQGALQQLQNTIQTLTHNKTPRAKVTAPPTQSDSESGEETQVQFIQTITTSSWGRAEAVVLLGSIPSLCMSSSSLSCLITGRINAKKIFKKIMSSLKHFFYVIIFGLFCFDRSSVKVCLSF
ncbi:hypothetical protein ILYODFUR_037415 [Ilyodon furcidens]|uniref:Pre-rRNA-processing protein TSR2 homolog n=1 Tax=Ilyodon furcidens TaxID=33524 RepID=A0ABV0UCX6_9TELE